jgi:hypothetical protein
MGLIGLNPGISGYEMSKIDASKPVSPEEELALEIALKRRYYPDLRTSGNFRYELNNSFYTKFERQFREVSASLHKRFTLDKLAAVDDASLRSILAMDEIDLDKMLDPWGNPFQISVNPAGAVSMIAIISAGADELPGTPDDLTAFQRQYTYFYGIGAKISLAFSEYEKRNQSFIRDYETLRDELRRQNFDLDALRDPWGNPYRFKFEIEGARYVLRVECGGADRKFGRYNDFTIWNHYTDYFAMTRVKMAAGIKEFVSKSGAFPADESEFLSALKAAGFDPAELKDPFGRRYYVVKETKSRYTDRRKIGNSKTEITPVTQNLVIYTIKSVGTDGLQGNGDDFELARFLGIFAEKKPDGTTDKQAILAPSSQVGGLTGTVMDPYGAVIPNSTVSARLVKDGRYYAVRTDDSGQYILGELPAGTYEVYIEAAGFKRLTIQGVIVEAEIITEMDSTLEVGTVSEAVTIVGGAEINSSNTSGTNISTEFFSNIPTSRTVMGLYTIAPGVARSGLRDASGRDRDPSVPGSSGPENDYILDGGQPAKTREQIETPRLREYFPETLLWFPELISGPDGKASFKFKLADSLTTWKVEIIGSTADGDVAIAQKEIRTFQPFFVDLDPPKFLTNGDEISLPVQVRNYTETKQKVNVTMAKADWFSFLGADSSQVEVDPSNSSNAVFGFRAATAIKDGKQRVTAIAQDDSDAIEKPVTVRPDGEEIVKTGSKLFTGTAVFDIDFPGALAKTQKAELKIYPNLLSHVAESVEGLLRRPYGCGEQTISSTYPNLMILKFIKNDGRLRGTAKKYLQKGYERLAGYQVADGGFSYWGGKDNADVALTAYALRFLGDAKEFIEVDPEIVKRAHDWLVRQQKPDGSWTKYNGENPTQTKLFTVYVARSLAMTGDKSDPVLAKAFVYLKFRNKDVDEPYMLALYGLALLDTGSADAAAAVAQKLEKMAVPEDGGIYWKLETNTPFYGWGNAGRLETTALVLQLLLRDAANRPENEARKALIGKATLFLLKNKDRYGVWYSTQTTINVLDAFLAALSTQKAGTAETLQISVNGKDLAAMPVPADQIEPLIVDLAGKLDGAANKVEVKAANHSTLMAQVVQTHYIDWKDSESARVNTTSSRTIRFGYTCDKTTAAIMQDITCSVEAERVGFQGYGMLLAEIGTPPGADVSRESLQAAIDRDWAISRYDILPDRIVVYMWAKAGGTKFNFKFRPRYGINAQTPPSTVYDYYNPDAKALVGPMRFVVGN